MNGFLLFMILIGAAAMGILGADVIIFFYRKVARALDKRHMKAAMAREEYLNRLYEESLYEEMDELAHKAKKEMLKRRRH